MGTIYRPINLTPTNETLDMTDDQEFLATISGSKCTDYQLVIKLLDGTLKYDSTKINLTTPLSDGDILTHDYLASAPQSIVNNSEYKWQLTVWNGTDYISTREIRFDAYTDPVVSITITSPVTSSSLDISPSYTQAESKDVTFYTYNLYDDSSELIFTSDEIFSFDLDYTLTGLVNGESYTIQLLGETEVGNTFIATESFNVAYSQPEVLITPTVTQDSDTSIVTVDWGEIIQITGTESNITNPVTYVNGLSDITKKSCSIPNNEYIDFAVDIPQDFSTTFLWKGESTFSGKICDLFGGDGYEFGYDNSLNNFYAIVNTVRFDSLKYTVDNTKIYLITLTNDNVFIKEI